MPLSGPWFLPTQPWHQDQTWSVKCGAGLTERGFCLQAMAPKKSCGRSAATHTHRHHLSLISPTPLSPNSLTHKVCTRRSKEMRASRVAAKLLLRSMCCDVVCVVAKTFTAAVPSWASLLLGGTTCCHCFLPAIQP